MNVRNRPTLHPMQKKSVLEVVISEELTYKVHYSCNNVWDGYNVYVTDITPAMPDFKFHAAKRSNAIHMGSNVTGKHAHTIAVHISKAEGWHNNKNRLQLFGVSAADTDVLAYVYKGFKKMLR